MEKCYWVFRNMSVLVNDLVKMVDANKLVKTFFSKDDAENFVNGVYKMYRLLPEYAEVSNIEKYRPEDSDTQSYSWHCISTSSNLPCFYRYDITDFTTDETEDLFNFCYERNTENGGKKMEQEKDCMYCDPDESERQPISYNTAYVGKSLLFTTGVFIHLENKRPELSSYVLNAEWNTICDDRVVIEYCPCCGRKLRKD